MSSPPTANAAGPPAKSLHLPKEICDNIGECIFEHRDFSSLRLVCRPLAIGLSEVMTAPHDRHGRRYINNKPAKTSPFCTWTPGFLCYIDNAGIQHHELLSQSHIAPYVERITLVDRYICGALLDFTADDPLMRRPGWFLDDVEHVQRKSIGRLLGTQGHAKSLSPPLRTPDCESLRSMDLVASHERLQRLTSALLRFHRLRILDSVPGNVTPLVVDDQDGMAKMTTWHAYVFGATPPDACTCNSPFAEVDRIQGYHACTRGATCAMLTSLPV